MRPLLVLVITLAILGGLQLYMATRSVVHPNASAYAPPAATGRFSLEVTLTFDAGPDAFALQVDDAPSVLVQHRGQDLIRSTRPVASGTTLRADDVAGVVAGRNEFSVRATPQEDAGDVARALRVRVFRDEVPVADETFWSEPGEPVEGVIALDVPADLAARGHTREDE